MSRRNFGWQLSSTGGHFWGPCWPCGLVGLVGHPAGGGTIGSGCWHCGCHLPGVFSCAAGMSHCFGNVAHWISSAFLMASVIDSRHDIENWNTVPSAKSDANRFCPKKEHPSSMIAQVNLAQISFEYASQIVMNSLRLMMPWILTSS
jgi:hypothetical protein